MPCQALDICFRHLPSRHSHYVCFHLFRSISNAVSGASRSITWTPSFRDRLTRLRAQLRGRALPQLKMNLTASKLDRAGWYSCRNEHHIHGLEHTGIAQRPCHVERAAPILWVDVTVKCNRAGWVSCPQVLERLPIWSKRIMTLSIARHHLSPGRRTTEETAQEQRYGHRAGSSSLLALHNRN
jgi:hypothetical protein